MSESVKKEVQLGIITILLTIMGSIISTVWFTAKIANQVETNSRDIKRIDTKVQKITQYLLDEIKLKAKKK